VLPQTTFPLVIARDLYIHPRLQRPQIGRLPYFLLAFTSNYTRTLDVRMFANGQETPPPSQSAAFLSAIVAATANSSSPANMDTSELSSRPGTLQHNPVSLLATTWMNSRQVALVAQDTGTYWYIRPDESS
jgi:hypothetical protein